MEQPFENPLTIADFSSQTWQRLEAVLEHRLDLARKRNDNPMPDEDRGMVLGEIANIKTLLRLKADALQDKDVFEQLYQEVGSPLQGRPVTPQTGTPVRRMR